MNANKCLRSVFLHSSMRQMYLSRWQLKTAEKWILSPHVPDRTRDTAWQDMVVNRGDYQATVDEVSIATGGRERFHNFHNNINWGTAFTNTTLPRVKLAADRRPCFTYSTLWDVKIPDLTQTELDKHVQIQPQRPTDEQNNKEPRSACYELCCSCRSSQLIN